MHNNLMLADVHTDPVEDSREPVRLLVVDDDPLCQTLCQRYLAQSDKYAFELVGVETGADAIRRVSGERFDCLLVDYYLPDLTGTELLRQLSALAEDDAPPAIILTANGGEEAAISAVRAGATDFLPKRALSRASLGRALGNAIYNSRLKQSIAAKRRELQKTNEQLKSRNEEIQRFYHSVSHEVKTPLTAVREFIALTRDGICGPVTAEQEEVLDHALDGCDQIAGHFNDLVEMMRLESSKISLDCSKTDMQTIVTQCKAGVASAVTAKELTLDVTVADGLPLLWLDRNRIIQVVSNLLGNAIKYTPAGGKVWLSIELTRAGEQVQIEVADTGCGIAPEHLLRIFDRLYQVDDKGDALMGAGLGLGLSIAKEIVNLHDGTIRARSVPGKGSVFTVLLPVKTPDLTETKV